MIFYFQGACGERLKKNEGEISFAYPKDLQTRSIQCFWIIQSSSPSPLQFYFTNFIFDGRCDTTFAFIYHGTVKMSISSGMHFCSNTPPKGLISTHGPYVTVFVQGQKTDLEKGSFKLLYGPNVTGKRKDKYLSRGIMLHLKTSKQLII